jgi:hypothetical protein
MISMRSTTWFDHCPAFSVTVLDAFCHALQSPEAAAVFSPSLGVCLLLLIWGFAPGIKLHRFRHRSQKLFCRRHSGLYLSPNLLLAAFFLHTKDRHGKKKACRITSCTPLVRPCVQVHPSVRACVCERERKKRGERENVLDTAGVRSFAAKPLESASMLP